MEIRKKYPVMVNGEFEILKTKGNQAHLFSYIRKTRAANTCYINNLSRKDKLIAEITDSTHSLLFKNNGRITSLKT